MEGRGARCEGRCAKCEPFIPHTSQFAPRPSPFAPRPAPLALFRLSLAHPMNSCIFAAAIGGIAQLARALAWHARGHRFESDYLHFKNPERVDLQRVRDFFLRFMPHLCHILRVFGYKKLKNFCSKCGSKPNELGLIFQRVRYFFEW
jgi:hypothetical protein